MESNEFKINVSLHEDCIGMKHTVAAAAAAKKKKKKKTSKLSLLCELSRVLEVKHCSSKVKTSPFETQLSALFFF